VKIIPLISLSSLATAFDSTNFKNFSIKNYSQRANSSGQPISSLLISGRMPEYHRQSMRNPSFSERFSQLTSHQIDPDESDLNQSSPHSVIFTEQVHQLAEGLSKKTKMDIVDYFYPPHKDEEKIPVAACLLGLLVNRGDKELETACIFISLLDPHKNYRAWFARELFTKDQELFGRYIGQIELSSCELDVYVQKLFQSDPSLLLEYSVRLIPDADRRNAIFPSLIQKAPAAFFDHCERLWLHESELHQYAKQYCRQEPQAFARNMKKMNFSVEQLKNYAVQFALENPVILRDSLHSFCLDSMPIENQQAMLQALFGENISQKDSWISERASFHKLKALVHLGCSIHSAVRMHESPLLKHDHIVDLIEHISSLERPEYHQKLLDAFDRLIKMPAISQSNYIELTKFLSLYGLPQSMLIYPMVAASSLSVDEKKNVMQDYGNKGFKNAFKLSKMLDFLVRLGVFENKPDIQACLLLATCPSVDESSLGKKQILPKLLANINLMQVVISCMELGFSAVMDFDLTELTSPKTLLELVKQLAIFVLEHEPTPERYSAIEKYFDRIDDPSCLLVWAAKQHEFCKKSPQQGFKNLASVKELSSWIINKDQKSRYQNNQALLLLKEKNEPAYRRWCELEAEPNLEITPMNMQIDSSGDVDESACVAKVTSSLDDILTCGTRVPGSCQHVNANGALNQGLIGYMKAAKMAGVWQKDALFGRNMLFLGWDPTQNKHVIVMAHHAYGQPECDSEYRKLMKLASQKYADWVGLELVDAAGSFGDPLNLLSSDTREIVLPLSDPTYIDGMGVCFHDIRLKVRVE